MVAGFTDILQGPKNKLSRLKTNFLNVTFFKWLTILGLSVDINYDGNGDIILDKHILKDNGTHFSLFRSH